jgi:hypothetical protein
LAAGDLLVNKSAARKLLRRLELATPERAQTLRDVYPGLPIDGEAPVAAAALNAALAVAERTNDRPTFERAMQLVAARTAANLIAGISPAAPRFPVGPDDAGHGDAGALDQLLVELGWDLSRPPNPCTAPQRRF